MFLPLSPASAYATTSPGTRQLDAKLPKFEAAFEMAAQWFNKQCEIHRRRASLLNEQAPQSAENERGLSGQAEKRPNSTAGDHSKTKKPKSAAP
ncbi:hypothetical protein FOZ60_015767 [Perkinsus olseni]|uniref:Uncharacterized protein n=1 Tax=Perkinsus olseni TaxID=32597 RepID=A0A7J6P7P1_PEROL|nr:hypothetical protein FOZ60_015767 [Perkinsus olseni]